jgi:uncharacterized protein (TIGR02186 family)
MKTSEPLNRLRPRMGKPRMLSGLAISIALCLLFAPRAPLAQEPPGNGSPELTVSPGVIRVDAFYKGTEITVGAVLPAGCDGAVVKIQGKDEALELRRKGRVSFIWLNVDDVTVSGAPSVYILNASAPLDAIATAEAQRDLLLGYDALKRHMDIRAKITRAETDFSELIQLKEHNGSYRLSETAQLLPAGDSAGRAFRAVVPVPPVMPSGDYRVRLYYFKDRVLLGEAGAALRVEMGGFPGYLHALAFNHPAAYGVFACIIAMATGIVMGLVFGSRSRRAH